MTAPTSAIPVPGVGAVLDLAVIFNETRDYREILGIPVNESDEFKKIRKDLQKRVLKYGCTSALKLAAEIAGEATLKLGAEEVAKYIPVAGSIIACAISAAFTGAYLNRAIDELEGVALEIWDAEFARSTNN